MGQLPCKRVVRVFISSTFTDTVFERNYTLEDVVPYLKKVGRERGCDIIFSEMRFGIRDDASEDNRTSELCMEELANYEQQSAGVFYVLISTDKYGFRPLPRRIPRNEMERLRGEMGALEQDLVDKFYSLDTNALDQSGHPAPEYVMLTQPEIGMLVEPSTDGKVATKLFWSNVPKVVETCRAAAIKHWSRETVEAELSHSERWLIRSMHCHGSLLRRTHWALASRRSAVLIPVSAQSCCSSFGCSVPVQFVAHASYCLPLIL